MAVGREAQGCGSPAEPPNPAWEVREGFPEEVTCKVTAKPQALKGEKDLAKHKTGKSHGQGTSYTPPTL